MIVTDSQWGLYLKKYGNLLWMISQKISGDTVISSLEDNYADLCVAAINSIKGFNKKTGKNFEEMINTKLFDQYTKTVLWNQKNKKGSKIAKKFSMLKRTWSTSAHSEGDDPFDIEDKNASNDYALLSVLLGDIDIDSKLIIETVVENPSVINAEGKLKVSALVKPTGLTIHSVRKAVARIEKFLGKAYETNKTNTHRTST